MRGLPAVKLPQGHLRALEGMTWPGLARSVEDAEAAIAAIAR